MARVCVVGAGPCGLIATKTLHQAGLEVDCLEMSSEIGGHWAYDNPNGRSAVYRSIHTNTTRAMSRLSDFDMPSDFEEFPSHPQVHRWWESYVDAFGFRDRIHRGVEVTAARPLEPEGWEIERRDGDGRVSRERYDALLACSGNSWAPRMPEIPGDFAGEVFHAQRYRDPNEPVALAGKRVVVVGIGNTGCELACEIAKAGAAAVFLSARGGTWILPQLRDGKPVAGSVPMVHPEDPVPAPFRMLPASARDKAFAWLSKRMVRRMFGARMRRLCELGLPEPPESPFAKRPTVSEPLLDALESGAVVARKSIARYDGPVVEFADGTREAVDVVIYATGYRFRYPYLPPSIVAPDAEDVSLFMGTLHPERRDLFFIGVSRPTGAFWPIGEVHARFVAALLSGRYALPDEATVRRKAAPILARESFNPALYGLAVREEIERGEKRAGTKP